jgi:hypothetical protein
VRNILKPLAARLGLVAVALSALTLATAAVTIDIEPTPVDIRRFGVVFDGAADNSAALQQAFDWVAANGGTLTIPVSASKARFSTGIVATLATGKVAHVIGEGSRSGLQYDGTGTAFTLNYVGRTNASEWKDFELCSPGEANGATAIRLDVSGPGIPNPANTNVTTFEQVVLRGCDDQEGSQGFTTGIYVNKVSNIRFPGLQIFGGSAGDAMPRAGTIGVKLVGDPKWFSVIYNFSGAGIHMMDKGIEMGTNVQGVTLTGGTNMVYVNKAVDVPSVTGTSWLTVADSQFDFYTCALCGEVSLMWVHDNLFYVHADNAVGIRADRFNDALIHHNTFLDVFGKAGTVGIQVDNVKSIGGIDGVISDNTFAALDTVIKVRRAGSYELTLKGNAYEASNTLIFDLDAGARILSVDRPIPLANTVACDLGHSGKIASISDSSVTTWGDPIVAGGAGVVLGHCNGSNWTVSAR